MRASFASSLGFTATERPLKSVSYAKRSLNRTPALLALLRKFALSFLAAAAEPPSAIGGLLNSTNQRRGVSLTGTPVCVLGREALGVSCCASAAVPANDAKAT